MTQGQRRKTQDSRLRRQGQSKIKSRKPKIPLVFVLIVTLAAVPFSLGKYFEFNQPDPFDGGAYVYSARHILAGAKIGVEEKPSALLGTLLVNMLGVWIFGFNETGAEIIQTIMQAAALVLMFIAMRKLFSTLAAAVGVIIASFYLSAPLIAKFGNVKEQYMIACMIMGISCYVLYQLGSRRWYAVLAGGFLSWAPLFKPTGVSAIVALGLFVLMQPILKNRTWKQTGIDILLLLAGVAAAVGPLFVWIIGWDVQTSLPYSFVWETVGKILPTGATDEQAKAAGSYIGTGRKLVPFSELWPRVLRFYAALILPVTLAVGSIILRIANMVSRKAGKSVIGEETTYDRFVLLFALWWLLDMGFVWISPRSYEQYYLPLNASAAMLGGYLITLYWDKLNTTAHKSKWMAVGLAGLLLMILMSQHIFFGIETSPHSGIKYPEGRRRGYMQTLNEISQRHRRNLRGGWEVVGEYIRRHSDPTDKIYVWGWYPGIYVAAQRFSSASKAFCMVRLQPQRLADTVTELLTEFGKEMPKFIVDSRKRDVPMDRPPYELWPIVPKGFMGTKQAGFLPLDDPAIAAYDKWWAESLQKRFDEDEAIRYETLKPFREFVMKNYKIVGMFGQHVLFELKLVPDSDQAEVK